MSNHVEFTTEIAKAAEDYFNSVGKSAHPLPAQFRWEECFRAMLAAAPVPATPVVPQGMALVPLRMTREMERVVEQEDWQWSEFLAAAETAGEAEPDAWMWQHDETGMCGFVQHAPDDELRHWERMNKPRKIICPLYRRPTPAPAQRMSKQQIQEVVNEADCALLLSDYTFSIPALVRAVESHLAAAWGVKLTGGE